MHISAVLYQTKSVLNKHCLSVTESQLFYTGPSAQYKRLVVMSEEQRRAVLEECHNNPGTGNHRGVRATVDRVVAWYYWDRIKADVADWVLFWNSNTLTLWLSGNELI